MNSDDQQLPEGFRFAGVTCGIKPSGKPDVALVCADRPVVAAGVYTQNQVVAAPVLLCRQRTPSSTIRAVIANSGNANACTGEQGMNDATEMCQRVAERVGCEPSDVLVMSTGMIGQTLPMDKIRAGIDDVVNRLSADQQGFAAASEAILTTDQSAKVRQHLVPTGTPIRLAAMAKGAGMIAPNMATMLSVICTDASLTVEDAQRLISHAAKVGFNRASVDGHTSTNDTLILMASGQGDPLSGQDLERFSESLDQIAIELAKELVADGEGAGHVMAIEVSGATDENAAEIIARTVAASPLVKTAITGGDPNWGRIVSAAGYAEAFVRPEETSLTICGTTIYENGDPQPFDAATLSRTMKASAEVSIELKVGSGPGKATFWSSDLSVEYVRFNSEYST